MGGFSSKDISAFEFLGMGALNPPPPPPLPLPSGAVLPRYGGHTEYPVPRSVGATLWDCPTYRRGTSRCQRKAWAWRRVGVGLSAFSKAKQHAVKNKHNRHWQEEMVRSVLLLCSRYIQLRQPSSNSTPSRTEI